MIIVAEGGVNHCGNFDMAMAMINVAQAVGADAIKFQAYDAKDIADEMNPNWKFYNSVTFEYNQYKDLISYGESIHMPVFFSTFSSRFHSLQGFTHYKKFAARQFSCKRFKENDNVRTIFSIPYTRRDIPRTKLNKVMHVSEYLTVNPRLEQIVYLSDHLKRRVGYSDHTVGISACIKAVEDYGANLIEKHFYLSKPPNLKFRDFEHGINYKDFETLVGKVKR